MLLARDRVTGEIVQADLLYGREDVDRDRYICPDCEIRVVPASYRRENLVRPYFTPLDVKHEEECSLAEERERELLDSARKRRVTTRAGEFPGSCPNALDLSEAHQRTTARNSTVVRGPQKLRDREFPPWLRRWPAKTLRPIALAFVQYPYDRDLDLIIPGIDANKYRYAFKGLNSLTWHPKARVFYAPVRWQQDQIRISDECMEIGLLAGEWSSDRKLVRSYRVRVEWAGWTQQQRNYVSRDVQFAKEEAMNARKKDSGTRIRGYVFFIGEQDREDVALFRVSDYRTICCVVDSVEHH